MGPITKIRFTLPDGRRLQRAFLASDTLLVCVGMCELVFVFAYFSLLGLGFVACACVWGVCGVWCVGVVRGRAWCVHRRMC